MLSPTPLSLFCALLLCLPLAVVFTIITPTTTNGGSTTTIPLIPLPIPLPITTTNKTGVNPVITTTATVSTNSADAAAIPTPITTTTNRISADPVTTFKLPIENPEKIKIKNKTTTSPPPPRRTKSTAESDDDSLFRRAARVNPSPSSPRKLAFMFLTTTPLPLSPLWELYFNQTPKNLYNIYIHADPSFSYDPPFSGVFENRVIPSSKPTRRYSPTLVSAARRLLSHALLHDPSNSMFALLSPACIPIHSFHFTYKTLVRSKKSFIEILNNEGGAYDRWAARGTEAMLPELPFKDFRIGSQFFVLTRKHARMVVGDRRLWSKFKLPCLRDDTCYPEEHYFPTLMSMKDPRGCVPATLTHVDWTGRNDGHPRTYNASVVGPKLIMALRKDRPRFGDDARVNGSDSSVTKRNHPFLFARKFSSDSIQPLLSIASDVIFKD